MIGVIRHIGTTVACRDLSCVHVACRLMFFEQAREQAESDFKSNPRDAQVHKTRTQRSIISAISPCDWTRPQGLMHLLPSAGAHTVGRCTPGAGPLPAGRRLLQHD